MKLSILLSFHYSFSFGGLFGRDKDLTTPCGTYDLSEFVSNLNLQFCTIVEIGQGYCSIFIEFRQMPDNCNLRSDKTAEIYLGICECSTIKSWEFCSIPLKQARPFECSLGSESENNTRSSRVHRRLCDPTLMLTNKNKCDCNKKFGQRTLYPITGFLTCYRAPLPESICTTHSVCGVSRCVSKFVNKLIMVHCDPLCLGKQPFCEQIGPVTSKAVIVTSRWSEWTCADSIDGVEISEAICLEKDTKAPAFDCLGPGTFCCPKDSDCFCIVSTSMSEMKVTRMVFSNEKRLNTRKSQTYVKDIMELLAITNEIPNSGNAKGVKKRIRKKGLCRTNNLY